MAYGSLSDSEPVLLATFYYYVFFFWIYIILDIIGDGQ